MVHYYQATADAIGVGDVVWIGGPDAGDKEVVSFSFPYGWNILVNFRDGSSQMLRRDQSVAIRNAEWHEREQRKAAQ